MGEHGWAQFAKNCRDGSDLYPLLVHKIVQGGRLPMSLDRVLRIRVSLGILMSHIKCEGLSKKSRCMAIVVVFLLVVDVCH